MHNDEMRVNDLHKTISDLPKALQGKYEVLAGGASTFMAGMIRKAVNLLSGRRPMHLQSEKEV